MKALLLFIFIVISNTSMAAKIGPFEVDLKFCRDVDKWSGILSSYSNVQFPVTGAPGITSGLMTNTSVIVDFCQYLIQMSSLDTEGQIFKTLEYANDLTGRQHNEELDLLNEFWSFSNSVYDFESGKGRKGKLEAASTHRRLNRLIRKSSDYYDNNLRDEGESPIDMQTRREAEADMTRLSRVAYRRAILDEALNCPKPKSTDDYSDLYQKEVIPQQLMIEQLEVYTDFYRRALMSMGPKFLMKDEYGQYLKDLNALQVKSSFLNVQVKTKTEETTKLRAKENIDENNPTEKRSEAVTEKIDQKYQLFQVQVNSKVLQDFIKKYSEKWKGWVSQEAVQTDRGILTDDQGGLGFLDGNKKRVEDEFKDFGITCNKGKIAQKYDRSQSNYDEQVQRELDECKKSANTDIKKAGGLLNFYAQDLYNKTRRIKQLRGNIWTFESYYLGNFRSISETQDNSVVDGMTQEKVQCAPIENLATMNQLSLKQQAANAELNQMIVEQLFKQNQLREQQLAAEAKEREDARRRAEIEREMKRRRSVDYYQNLEIPSPDDTL